MKQILPMVMICIMAAQCGKDDDTAIRQEQARRDSLEAVQAARQVQIAEETAAAEAQSDVSTFDPSKVSYSDSGTFAVQVGAWRSEEKAGRLADVWKQRGFEKAFVESYGTPATGDVWFRVRLGRTSNRIHADGMAAHVNARYGVTSWVADYK